MLVGLSVSRGMYAPTEQPTKANSRHMTLCPLLTFVGSLLVSALSHIIIDPNQMQKKLASLKVPNKYSRVMNLAGLSDMHNVFVQCTRSCIIISMQ